MNANSMRIHNLRSGGLITNYSCASRCPHCLYNCGPEREKDYIAREAAETHLRRIRAMGCPSVHIGGGSCLSVWRSSWRCSDRTILARC